MRKHAACVALLLFVAACASRPVDTKTPRPDPFWPERLHYGFTGAGVSPDLPVIYALNGDFRVRVGRGRMITVRDVHDIDMYAPDLRVLSLVRYGYHAEGADSETTILHLVTGASLNVSGFLQSTPRRDLLLRNGSGTLYEGGVMSLVRVTDRGFERLGGDYVDYSFEPRWESPSCVEFVGLDADGAESTSEFLIEQPNGRWEKGEGRCPAA